MTNNLSVAVDNTVQPEVGRKYITANGHITNHMTYKNRNDSGGYCWHTQFAGQSVRRSYNQYGKCKGAERGYDLSDEWNGQPLKLGKKTRTIPMRQTTNEELMAIIDKELGILSLEVGKTYKDGRGDTHLIIWYNKVLGVFIDEVGTHYKPNGRLTDYTDICDLVAEYIEPESGIGYLNVYRDKQGVIVGQAIYTNTEAAHNAASGYIIDNDCKYIARAKVMWVEGQFEE
jgi:hypothetical protein